MATKYLPTDLSSIFDMSGKTAVVFGGAGGLGNALARGLAAFGANVVISSRREDALIEGAKLIEADAKGGKVSYCAADACKVEDIEKVKDFAIKEFGSVEILVCSQGFNKKHDIVEFDMADWQSMFDTNVTSVFNCVRIFGTYMKQEAKYGKIVVVTSVRDQIATFPGGGNAGYCATKGALTSIIKQAATELAPEVTVNGIGPTVTLTPMMESIVPKQAQEVSIPADHPLGRMAKPEDIIGAGVYLCADASCYHTGQVLYPDGGLLCKG